jgi:hypothetical protein
MNASKDWSWPVIIGAGALLVAGGLGLYFLRANAPDAAPEAAPEAVVDEAPPAPEPIPPRETLPPRTVPLPPLDQSDADVSGGLTEVFGENAVMEFLVPERVVRNIVVTIDNATREQMALNQRPIKATPGEFIVTGPEDALVIAPENYARYEPLVAIVLALDAKTLVSLYRGLEPLFQQAYEELGHPDAEFDKRLSEVIEHLLATPNVPGQIRLVQPSVHYRFADERLEKLSSGQKLLLRMGPENAAVIKGKLREIQAELL